MKPLQYSLALAVGAALVVAPVASAQAAASVTIQTIPTTTVKFDTTKTFKPKYVAQKNVKVDKAVLKVVKDGKVIASDAPSVKLGKGTYSVRQTVVYRTFTGGQTSKVVIKKGDNVDAASCTITGKPVQTSDAGGTFTASCAPTSNDEYVSYGDATFPATGEWTDNGEGGYLLTFDDEGEGNPSDTVDQSTFGAGNVADVEDITATQDVEGTRTTPVTYGDTTTVSKSQKLTVKSLKEPKGCASNAEIKSVKRGFNEKTGKGTGDTPAVVAKKLDSKGKRDFKDGSFEQRSYKACAGYPVIVGFPGGRASYVERGGPQSGGQ